MVFHHLTISSILKREKWRVREQIEEKTKIPLNRQRLIFLGKLMQDDVQIKEYKIKSNSFVHLIANTRETVSQTEQETSGSNNQNLKLACPTFFYIMT